MGNLTLNHSSVVRLNQSLAGVLQGLRRESLDTDLIERISIASVQTYVDALSIDEDEDKIRPESKLIQDLGAESIDFLDINFRLEKSFDVKIPRSYPLIVLEFPDYMTQPGGRLNNSGIKFIRETYPYLFVGLNDEGQDRFSCGDLNALRENLNVLGVACGLYNLISESPGKK